MAGKIDMLKTGAFILAAWCWLNVLPAVVSLLSIALGKHAPGILMRFAPEEVPYIEERALAVIDGLAVLLNTLIAIYCITGFFIVRNFLLKKELSLLAVFALGTLVLQGMCYLSDYLFFLGKNALLIHLSSLILLTGFCLCAVPIFKKQTNRAA